MSSLIFPSPVTWDRNHFRICLEPDQPMMIPSPSLPLTPPHALDSRSSAYEFAPATKRLAMAPLLPSTRWMRTVIESKPLVAEMEREYTPCSSTYKCSLSFILSPVSMAPSSSGSETESDQEYTHRPSMMKRRRSPSQELSEQACSPSIPQKKGSKYCIVEGCTSRAKHARRCWRHGGSVKCKVPDCINRAKSKGVCWSHGGGTMCSHPNCETIAVSHGFCWAHGGGKRCQVDGCSRPAYERTDNYCSSHYKQYHQ